MFFHDLRAYFGVLGGLDVCAWLPYVEEMDQPHLWFTSNPHSDRRWILWILCPLALTGWTGFGLKSGHETFWENEV